MKHELTQVLHVEAKEQLRRQTKTKAAESRAITLVVKAVNVKRSVDKRSVDIVTPEEKRFWIPGPFLNRMNRWTA